ncbi:MAG: aspartate--tRNA ligase [Christensenellales bacterium]
MEGIHGLKRSLFCGQLRAEHAGRQVTLMGWVARCRNLGGMVFVTLRDKMGVAQVIFDEKTPRELFEQAEGLHSEDCVALVGTVRLRGERDRNPNMPTGEVEVAAHELRVLSRSAVLPFPVDDEHLAAEPLRIKHRYLDLRREGMQRRLRVRNQVKRVMRSYLESQGFEDIETPMLINSTPEGARDFLVPSRKQPGSFYALPQSPQIFKQLLMVAGFDRYYQLARCFRDEDGRGDRQPEFTQLDLEMSFVEQEDVMALNEGLLKAIFQQVLGVEIPMPMPRITYRDAMARYGSDKPDTRFEVLISDVSEVFAGSEFRAFADAVAAGGQVAAIAAPGAASALSRREIDALTEVAKTYRAKGMAFAHVLEDGYKSSLTKFLSKEQFDQIAQKTGARVGDTLLLIADAKAEVACVAMGQVRLAVAEKLGLIPENQWNLLWVTEFPFFERDDEGHFVPAHHPFTMPLEEDLDKFDTDKAAIRAYCYDIVLNGVELGSGSIRIHDKQLQNRMFEQLGMTAEQIDSKFGYLVNAFQYGPPPHGGFAYGVDRLVMLLTGSENIREVIPFPKLQNASDPLTNAPLPVDAEQLKELGLSVSGGPQEDEPQ